MNLKLQNITKAFGTKKILEDISFEINKGEFVSLIGPSGSGKSTLFSLIGGLLTPEVGDIYMNEEQITGKRGYISYMPQQASLLPWRTILGNVVLGQELYGVKDEEKAKKMLDKAGLADVTSAYPHQLSGGMKQRAAFIRTLMSPQSFMCLDEPFSALDEFTRLDMQKWLLSIWEAHKRSVLFITHNIEEALFLSDKIIILTDRPAEVKRVIEIPFPRPRNEEILLSTEFLDWKRELMEVIKK